MAVGMIAIQTLLFFVTYTVAGQSSSSCSPIIVVLVRTAAGATGNADPTCLLQNPPVARRNDYTYFPGIGGYKLHSEVVSWNQARITCEEEGGHLAIINSLAERDAVVTVLKAINPHPSYVSLGFHGLYERGHYVTIHGQTPAKAGFNEWAKGEPNNPGIEDCGSLESSGGLNDHNCHTPHSFMCELPIH